MFGKFGAPAAAAKTRTDGQRELDRAERVTVHYLASHRADVQCLSGCVSVVVSHELGHSIRAIFKLREPSNTAQRRAASAGAGLLLARAGRGRSSANAA